MKNKNVMWCVLTHKHPNTGNGSICQSTLSRRKKDAIEKFVDGSGSDWRYWKRNYNFTCEKVVVTVETISKVKD